MSGIFEIHPTGESAIVCDTTDTRDVSLYLLVSQDLKEGEREKIVYSEGKFNGSVIDSTASIVTASFQIVVHGDTLEEVAANVATLKSAFFNAKGGTIEYRPVGYAASVISTFYKYLKSPPPTRLNPDVVIDSSENYEFAEMYEFLIEIFSLATSDPDDMFSTIASGDVWTYTDGAELGYLALPSSSIKGDGLFPIISVEGYGTVGQGIDELIVSFCEIDSGSPDLDWYGSAYSMSAGVSFSAANRFYTASTSTGWSVMFTVQTTSSKFFGRCVPLVSFRINDASEWQVRLLYSGSVSTSDLPLTGWMDLVPFGGFWTIAALDSISMPPLPYPDIMPIANLDSRIGFEVREKNSVPGNIQVYGLLLAPVDRHSWIAKFTSTYMWTTDTVRLNAGLSVNCPAGANYRWPTSPTTSYSHSWEKRGMPIGDAIMPKGNYQIRYLGNIASSGWSHDLGANDNKVAMTVAGQFFTIYPFSES